MTAMAFKGKNTLWWYRCYSMTRIQLRCIQPPREFLCFIQFPPSPPPPPAHIIVPRRVSRARRPSRNLRISAFTAATEAALSSATLKKAAKRLFLAG